MVTAAGRRMQPWRTTAAICFVQGGSDQINSEKTESTPDQTLTTTESVNDVGGDDGTDYTDSVKTTSETVLLDGTVTCGLEKNWGISSDSGDTSPERHDLRSQASHARRPR